MAALFLPLFLFFYYSLSDVHDSIVKMQQQVKSLAELDRELGNKAENLNHTINAALAINVELGILYAMCPSAVLPPALAALQAKGQVARVLQEGLLQAARVQMGFVSPLEFEKKLNLPKRRSPSVCQLPGMLYCPEEILFSIRTRDGTKPAGVESKSGSCFGTQWSYSDTRVRPL